MSLCIVAVKDLVAYVKQERAADLDNSGNTVYPDCEFSLYIGYGDFSLLRWNMGDALGFRHYFKSAKEPEPFPELWIDSDDNAPEHLKRFFFHSDCDGEYSSEDVKKLAESINEIETLIDRCGESDDNFNDFKNFVIKSAKEHLAWIFC